MPKPTIEQLQNLGEAVEPFERTNFKRKVLQGEAIREEFISQIYDATEDGYPNEVKRVSFAEIEDGQVNDSKYLWVIDENRLTIILENTPNEIAERGCVCHTNLTEGRKAIQGGELWFGQDNEVYINNKSGRYGATTLSQRNAAIDYFWFVGYKNVKQLK